MGQARVRSRLRDEGVIHSVIGKGYYVSGS
jgi:hypothetical protein